MNDIALLAKFYNLDFLKRFLNYLLSPRMQYKNAKKVEYWKRKAYEAINNHNAVDLQNACMEIWRLRIPSSNDANSVFGSDLTI